MRRTTTGAAVAILVAWALAACTSSSTAAVSPSPPSPSPSPSASPSSVASPATPTATPTPRCAVASLSIHLLGTNGAAGHIAGTVELENTGAGPCQLYGYPGLGLLDSGGHDLPTTVVRGESVVVPRIAPRTVVLEPGGMAAFLFGYSDVPTGTQTCPQASKLEVTPPNDFDHAVISASLAPCGGVITVSPVFGGTVPPTS